MLGGGGVYSGSHQLGLRINQYLKYQHEEVVIYFSVTHFGQSFELSWPAIKSQNMAAIARAMFKSAHIRTLVTPQLQPVRHAGCELNIATIYFFYLVRCALSFSLLRKMK